MNQINLHPVETFDSFFQAFINAENSSGNSERLLYNIAGHEIEIRLATSALTPYIAPGLEHLKSTSERSPALTICAWDSVSTGEQMPPPPWNQDEYDARGEVRGFYDDRIYAAFHLDANILSMLDIQRNIALFWIRDAIDVPPHIQAVPFRPVFHWWMREQGLLFVHAASTGLNGSGALVVGKGGSGKSSTALSCFTSGMLYLGDDHVLIKANPDPYVFSMYNSAKMDSLVLEKLKGKTALFDDAKILNQNKAVVFLNQKAPSQLTSGLPLRAVIVPYISQENESKITPVSPMTAVKALAPSTILMLSGAGKKDLSEMVKTVRQVPCFSLQIGSDLWEVPELIQQVLS